MIFCKRNNCWKKKEERTSETARIIMGPQGPTGPRGEQGIQGIAGPQG